MGHSDTHAARPSVRVTEGKKRETVKAAVFHQATVLAMPGLMRREA